MSLAQIRSKTKTGTSVSWCRGAGGGADLQCVGCVQGQAARCGDGGSRRTALLIGLHRLRPANSEHQWAETDWASWVTKSHSSSSLICQKKVHFSFPRQMFLKRKFWDFGLKKNGGRQILCMTSLDSLLLWSYNHPCYNRAIQNF